MVEGSPKRTSEVSWLVIDAVVVLTAIGLVLRLHGIDTRGAWWDEVATWHTALSGIPMAQEAPLNGWMVRLVMEIMRRNDTYALHIPAALFGTLTIPAAFLLGKRIAGEIAGLVAATLVTITPILLGHSQEARPYGLLVLVTVLQLEAGLRLTDEWSRRRLAWLCLCTSAALSTHLLALGLTGGISIAVGGALLWELIWARGRRKQVLIRLGATALAMMATGALSLLWTRNRPTLNSVMQERYTYGPKAYYNYILGSTVPAGPLQKLYLALALVGVIALLYRRRAPAVVAILLGWAFLFGGLYMTLGEKGGWNWSRYTTPWVVPFLVLVAAGVTSLGRVRPTLLLWGLVMATHYADPTQFYVWYHDAPVVRGVEYYRIADEVKRASKALKGLIFVQQTSVYGDESTRLYSSYALKRKDDLPAYFSEPWDGGIREIEWRHVAGDLAVPVRKNEKLTKLPEGFYAVFYGWDSDRGCETLSHLLEYRTYKGAFPRETLSPVWATCHAKP